MPTAKVRGAELFYTLHGDGPPVLMIMGFGASQHSWAPQIAGLAGRFQLCVFDNRGAGRSTASAPPYTMAQLAGDARGVMDAVGWPTANVVGFSMGGMIAQRMALQDRGRVRTLSLLATHAGGWAARPPRAILRSILTAPMRRTQRGRQDWMIRLLHSQKYIDEVGLETVRQSVRERFTSPRPSPKGWRGQLAAILNHATHDELPTLRGLPGLVVCGTGDRLVRPENSEQLADALDAPLIQLDGYGHAIHVEQSQALNAALRRTFMD